MKRAEGVDRGQSVLVRQCDDQITLSQEERFAAYDQGARPLAVERRKALLDLARVSGMEDVELSAHGRSRRLHVGDQ